LGKGLGCDERAFEVNMGVDEGGEDVSFFGTSGGLYAGDTFPFDVEDGAVGAAVDDVDDIGTDGHQGWG
jgi:hypothetical protein